MNGPIAQMVALTCHGNAYLAGRYIGAFFPQNSTCTFCDRVNFVTVDKSFSGKTIEKEIAQTPDEWFLFLKLSNASGIRLSRTPQNALRISDRMSAGFIGGDGTWAMEILFPKNRSEYVQARWEVWNRDAADRRFWRVTYGRISTGETPKINSADLTLAVIRLTESLREIHAFAAQHDCGGLTKAFADALDTLDSKGQNLHGYYQDLCPANFLSLEAITLLDACQSAWVFGGMGSWNDLGFYGDDEKKYEQVSEQLFQAVNGAIIAAGNSRTPLA